MIKAVVEDTKCNSGVIVSFFLFRAGRIRAGEKIHFSEKMVGRMNINDFVVCVLLVNRLATGEMQRQRYRH